MHRTDPQSWRPHSLSKGWCRWQDFLATLELYVHHCFQDEEWAYTLRCVHTLLQALTTSAALLAWQQPWMQAPSAFSPLTEGASQGCLERAPSARKEVRPRTSSCSLPSRHTFSQWCQPRWWGNLKCDADSRVAAADGEVFIVWDDLCGLATDGEGHSQQIKTLMEGCIRGGSQLACVNSHCRCYMGREASEMHVLMKVTVRLS